MSDDFPRCPRCGYHLELMCEDGYDCPRCGWEGTYEEIVPFDSAAAVVLDGYELDTVLSCALRGGSSDVRLYLRGEQIDFTEVRVVVVPWK